MESDYLIGSPMFLLRAWANDFCWEHGYSLAIVCSTLGPHTDPSLRATKRELAQALHKARYTYGDIALLLDCGGTTVHDLVRGRQ